MLPTHLITQKSIPTALSVRSQLPTLKITGKLPVGRIYTGNPIPIANKSILLRSKVTSTGQST